MQTHNLYIHTYVCSSESSSLIVFVIGGFSQFGINTNRCCYVCLYVNAFIRVCVCQLILLLNCFCTEQVLKNTTRQSDRQPESDIVVACCACEWNRQRLTLITVIPCVREYMYIYILIYIHTVCMFVICLCFVVAFYICATARCCLFHLFTVIVLLPDHE